MRHDVIGLLTIFSASPALAGHADQATFYAVPVLGEAGLVALAIGIGLGGARALRRYRNK